MLKKLLLLLSAVAIISSCSEKMDYSISLSKSTLILPAEACMETVEVITNSSWSAVVDTEDASWIKVTPEQSDSQRADLTISVEKNLSGDDREGTVRIICGDNIRAITVNQEEEATIELGNVVGSWTIVECDDSPAMITSKFVFNADMSCTAKIAMTGGPELAGTYTLIGNVITVTVGGMTIPIAIDEMTLTNMDCMVMGRYEAELVKGL